mgnify:CR=1 FL=1
MKVPKIPDPIVIFIGLYLVAFVCSVVFGGTVFQGPDGGELCIRSMATVENVRWAVSNCLIRNWVAYAHGMLPIVFVVMMGIGVAEQGGLFSAMLRLLGRCVNGKSLAYLVVGAGILSNVASDAGYLVLIPLAATLYATVGRSPLVGIAAGFAGVSAGFGANLIPATPNDVVIGVNTLQFAEQMGVPTVSYLGRDLCAPTMDYYYMSTLFVLFTLLGGFVTNRIVEPRLGRLPWTRPDDFSVGAFELTDDERGGLRWGVAGLAVALVVSALFACFPLAPYVDEVGRRHTPFMDNVIVFVSFSFFLSGIAYGWRVGKYRTARDVIAAASRQLGGCGYLAVLTFVSFNFLAMFNHSGLAAWIACSGARGLLALDLGTSPCLLLIVFIVFGALVNCFISSLSAKWMLLGPVFVPMLYGACHELTPEVVTAAYRTADPSTNVLTPVMTFAGVVLVFCRKWKADFSLGDQIAMMLPYSALFLPASTLLLIAWFKLSLPFGF